MSLRPVLLYRYQQSVRLSRSQVELEREVWISASVALSWLDSYHMKFLTLGAIYLPPLVNASDATTILSFVDPLDSSMELLKTR